MTLRRDAIRVSAAGAALGILASCTSSGDGALSPTAVSDGGSSGDAGVSTVGPSLTYYRDVQPIIESKCTQCHNPAGIGPFSFQTAEDVISRKSLILAAVTAKTMPPWPASDSCGTYERDRSLSESELGTITDWITAGASAGDPATQSTASVPLGLSRVDLTLQMPEPYTPKSATDDYRCFMVDWTPTVDKYVTGFGVRPGNAKIVHHTIAFIATPDQVADYQALDDAEPGPGWTCFGGPGVSSQAQWLGAWAPGSLGSDFPEGTGVLVGPSSKIVIQVHYNTANSPAEPDQTSIDVEVADTVAKAAAVVPFADPGWLSGTMPIPAGAPDTSHSFGADITPYMALLTGNAIRSHVPLTIYSAALHMHTRGSSARTVIKHAGAAEDCMLEIPAWNFNWQGQYGFSQPKTLNPGDQLYLECHWDNTAAHQPYVNGQQVLPQQLNWGETTEDEMCLAVLYLTE